MTELIKVVFARLGMVVTEPICIPLLSCIPTPIVQDNNKARSRSQPCIKISNLFLYPYKAIMAVACRLHQPRHEVCIISIAQWAYLVLYS